MKKAYGSHNNRKQETKAKHVAESMNMFKALGNPKNFAFYGIDENSEYAAMIKKHLV